MQRGNIEYNFAVLEDGSVYMKEAQLGSGVILQNKTNNSSATIGELFSKTQVNETLLSEFDNRLTDLNISKIEKQLTTLRQTYADFIDLLAPDYISVQEEGEIETEYLYGGEGQFKKS